MFVSRRSDSPTAWPYFSHRPTHRRTPGRLVHSGRALAATDDVDVGAAACWHFRFFRWAKAGADVPDWSGLDARLFAGPIPPQGTTVASVPLDPALSLTGAGPAYRVLYSTINQHDQPAVSTGAVFLPPGPAPEGGFRSSLGRTAPSASVTTAPRPRCPRTPRDDEYLSHWLGRRLRRRRQRLRRPRNTRPDELPQQRDQPPTASSTP